MRIEQLEYVAAVTRHGSLRRASEKLHLSQPALSEAVTKLERELGVVLLDRLRSGARISRRGRDLQPFMAEVLEAVERLREAATEQATSSRCVRLGTVNAATSTLLVPAVRAFQESEPGVTVEVLTSQQAEIDEGLEDGTLDLGLVNVMTGDDPPSGLLGTDLLRGRPVVVLPTEHPLASRAALTVDDLRRESFVMMRSGYLMHRFAHRIFGAHLPPTCHSTDGAEMGKVLVAEGLGLTVLPDFSVVGDPLERAGVLTHRPLAEDRTEVTLVLRRRATRRSPRAVHGLADCLIAHAESTAVPEAS